MKRSEKLKSRLICPVCQAADLNYGRSEVVCQKCGERYPMIDASPFLLKPDSRMRSTYLEARHRDDTFNVRLNEKVKMPEERLWSRRAKGAIHELLERFNPDDSECFVMNIGAGFENVFRREFGAHSDIFRLGLPHVGDIDVFADALNLPLQDNSVDLLFTSSVIEHLENPELAAREIQRVLRPHGVVYAEVPFMRAYHMIPVDYQRYTIQGLCMLFERNGFETLDKGVSSGPFTAMALLIRDFVVSVVTVRYVRGLVRFAASWLVQPIKYVDWLVGDHDWTYVTACNFFYVGQKR